MGPPAGPFAIGLMPILRAPVGAGAGDDEMLAALPFPLTLEAAAAAVAPGLPSSISLLWTEGRRAAAFLGLGFVDGPAVDPASS